MNLMLMMTDCSAQGMSEVFDKCLSFCRPIDISLYILHFIL